MADKTITCKDCNSTFVFTESEQDFYREKGFDNEPQRCPSCRAAKKQQQGGGRGSFGGGGNRGGYGSTQREMFPATCAECGNSTTVPFKPNGEKPVYCKDCYQNRR